MGEAHPTLGETNGKWLILFKIVTAAFVPAILLVISLQIWVVNEIFALERRQAVKEQWMATTEEDRFRKRDALQLEVDLTAKMAEIWRVIRELPPDAFEAKFEKLIQDVSTLEKRVEVHIARDHNGRS